MNYLPSCNASVLLMKPERWLPLLALLLCSPLALAKPGTAVTPPAAAISSAHPLATAAGMQVLKAGGNAFDAAVAVSAALAVVEPAGSGLGGGGFWLLHRVEDGLQIMVDGRERAPLGADANFYADAPPRASLDGPLAAGIPGEPAALAHIAKTYGKLPLAQSLAPAIRLAQDGYAVDERMHRLLQYRADALRASPAAAEVFLPNNTPANPGFTLQQPDLARTLTRLAAAGHAGFYAGETAQLLIAGVQEAGGRWTAEDLAAYQIVERRPVVSHYRDYRIVSAAPPSSGGIVLAQALQMLAPFNIAERKPAERLHLIVEALRRAYRDRAAWLGDPDHVAIQQQLLTHPYYAAGLRAGIHPDKATPSANLPPAAEDTALGQDTTHFSILDTQGNRVAATLSVNLPFGSGFMAPGTGVLLNNEMDDFAAHPGQPNAYGLVHGAANAVGPGKRPLSSMSPTFVEGPQGVLIVGTPGGSRIITMVLLAALEWMDAGAEAETLVSLPRIHHQYLPDVISYEKKALNPELIKELQARGHQLKARERSYGNMHVVIWSPADQQVTAAADPRGVGAAAVSSALAKLPLQN